MIQAIFGNNWNHNYSKEYLKWFEEKYGKEHHVLCEIMGYGVCTCHDWAYAEWKKIK